MAEFLTASRIFDNGHIIGIGSGRGVWYTVDALTQSSRFRAENVTVMSLTGSVHSRGEGRKFWLDADTHAAMFATCFDRDVALRLIRRPLTHLAANDIKSGTLLSQEEWANYSPTHALVGVGILVEGTRFFEEATAQVEDREPILEPIHDSLEFLVRLCRRFSSENFTPVAEISNHLLYIHSSDRQIPESVQKEIKTLIMTINQQMLSMSEDQVSAIDQILLVAGTAKKALAVRELLVNPRYHVRALCTDEKTAIWLLTNPVS